MPHVHALLDRLIEGQRIEVYSYVGERTPEAVCMNPDRPCEYCIFETSRWCSPEEREAKARADK